MRRSWMCAVVFSCFLSAVGQTRVCMGGNLDALSAADRHTCEDQVTRAREAATRTNAPADWHFVVVCGEDGWKDYTAFSNAGEAVLLNASADTDAVNKTTFLRGTRMTTLDASVTVITKAFRPQPTGVQIAER